MVHKLFRAGIALIASLIAIASFSVVAASAASAQEAPVQPPVIVRPHHCPDWNWFNGDYSRRGTFTGWFVGVYNGPAHTCRLVGVGRRGDQVWFHCWKESSDGQTWSHIRYYNRRIHRYFSGWARDSMLSGDGARTHC